MVSTRAIQRVVVAEGVVEQRVDEVRGHGDGDQHGCRDAPFAPAVGQADGDGGCQPHHELGGAHLVEHHEGGGQGQGAGEEQFGAVHAAGHLVLLAVVQGPEGQAGHQQGGKDQERLHQHGHDGGARAVHLHGVDVRVHVHPGAAHVQHRQPEPGGGERGLELHATVALLGEEVQQLGDAAHRGCQRNDARRRRYSCQHHQQAVLDDGEEGQHDGRRPDLDPGADCQQDRGDERALATP